MSARPVLIAASCVFYLFAVLIFGAGFSLNPKVAVPPSQTARVQTLHETRYVAVPGTPIPTRTRTIYDDRATSTAVVGTAFANATIWAIETDATIAAWTPPPPFKPTMEETSGWSETR